MMKIHIIEFLLFLSFSLINFFYKLVFHSRESGYIPYKQIQ